MSTRCAALAALIVVGGLMQEREIASTSKVPVLGDIPILGHLFKYSNKSKKKTTLLIMLTPYIIKDQTELESIRERKVREYDEFAGSFKALDGMAYRPRLDYRRKRGLVEDINRAVLDVEADVALRAQVRAPARGTLGPGLGASALRADTPAIDRPRVPTPLASGLVEPAR